MQTHSSTLPLGLGKGQHNYAYISGSTNRLAPQAPLDRTGDRNKHFNYWVRYVRTQWVSRGKAKLHAQGQEM